MINIRKSNKMRSIRKSNKMRSIAFILFFLSQLTFSFAQETTLKKYNIVWNSPSESSWGSMPIGNGDIGSNVWVTPDGVLHYYISKTDAFSENGRLLKVGKASVRFTPNVLAGENFKQELDLESGIIKISTDQVNLRFYVDANNPIIVVTGESKTPVKIEVNYDGWRNKRRELSDLEMHSARALMGGSNNNAVVEPDTVLNTKNGILWCHQNKRSVYNTVLNGVDLKEVISKTKDPLLNRTFGAYIFGDNLVNNNPEILVSKSPSKTFQLNTLVVTQTDSDISSWKKQVENQRTVINKKSFKKRFSEHINWWNQFWNNHYIYIDSEKDKENAFTVNSGYILQRYMYACSGRGNMPIKYNGSIFNVDVAGDLSFGGKNLKGLNADYRNWGGNFWWQNTRLPYWGMLHAGDFEMMLPLFKMYMEALDLSKLATREYFNHDGAHFPETMYFWGTYGVTDYGWKRKDMAKGIPNNHYIRYYWQSGLELVSMMQEYYLFTNDEKFLEEYLTVFAKEILTFYDEHYQKNNSGEIVFSPAHSLETFFSDVLNPLPEIAGLKIITNRFLNDKIKLSDNQLFDLSKKINSALPEIPLRTDENGNELISPAQEYNPGTSNFENPELYAIFPYPLYGLGKENLEMAQKTYDSRKFKEAFGWQQDAIQAALVGKTEEAKKMVVNGFKSKHKGSRFPAIWGPNYDWIPDQCHGSVNVRALQNMIIQEAGDKILLCPAWPKEWDVDFKFHASKNTVVEGHFKNGKIEGLKVTPKSRSKDVVIMKNITR